MKTTPNRHMLDAAEEVIGFTSGRERAISIATDLCSCRRGIEIIGEPADVTMRHRLIHGYFDVDPDIVWRTATEEVPALILPLRDLEASD